MYNYESEKPWLFTDQGQRSFLKVRDWCKQTLKTAGAFRAQEAMSQVPGASSNWEQLACLDRLVELGEVKRATPVGTVSTQYEIFVSTDRY